MTNEYIPEDGYPESHDEMSLSVVVNGKVYRLSDEFKSEIEQIAENEYGENEFLEYHWRIADDEDEHDAGDALLCIETHGKMIPWDDLSEFEVKMQGEAEASPDQQDPQGVRSVDKEEVDMDEGDDETEDFKLTMSPEDFRAIPDPEDDKFSTLPTDPEEYDEEDGPIMVLPIPENQREERWGAGQSITPQYTLTEWNMQARADSANSFGEPAHGDSHDKWEEWLESCDCEITGKQQTDDDADSSDEPDQGESTRNPYAETSDMGGKYGGDNFHV